MIGDPRQLVFVHGIGGIRDAAAERDAWLAALARGANLPPIDVRFVDYSSEFAQDGAQGGADIEAELLLELVDELVAELSEDTDPVSAQVLADARMQLSGAAEQGPGQVVRSCTVQRNS